MGRTHSPLSLPPGLKSALAELCQASQYALNSDSSVWYFAISVQRLLQVGATETDLRWLVRKGFVEHRREVTVAGDDGREFRPTGNLTFSRRTCFVITEAGLNAAQSSLNPSNNRHSIASPTNGRTDGSESLPAPQWDSKTRELRMNGQVVKRFVWPATNQEAVLCVFEEEGWPRRIDDPLSPLPEQDPKRRLADTIKCLNRKQVNKLIHFRGDGSGEGVIWEQVERSDTENNS